MRLATGYTDYVHELPLQAQADLVVRVLVHVSKSHFNSLDALACVLCIIMIHDMP
jgi:hypothetical protein